MEDQWDMGLPSTEELIPLTQSLITPELALAFNINLEYCKSLIDLNMVSYDTGSTIYPEVDHKNLYETDNFDALSLRLFSGRSDMGGSERLNRGESLALNEVNSGARDDAGDDNGPSRAVKRPRLVWTPQLHKRFVDVIEHLGIHKAVPKTIMEMMNVEGLTRENVASHLQKYRLYLRRVEGLANEPHSTARRASTMFDSEGFGSSSTPTQMSMPMPFAMPMSMSMPMPPQPYSRGMSLPLMPMPMAGPTPGQYGGGFGQMGLPGFNCGIETGGFGLFWNRQQG